jgi:hypothetical protein
LIKGKLKTPFCARLKETHVQELTADEVVVVVGELGARLLQLALSKSVTVYKTKTTQY